MDEWQGRMSVELKYSVEGAMMRGEVEYKKRPEKEEPCIPCYGV